MDGVLALLFNLDLSEIAIVLIGAILVFGRNLPQVAMRGAAQFVRLRRQLMQVWREAGFEEELRKAQFELENAVPRLPPPKSFLDAADAPPSSSSAAVSGENAAQELATNERLDDGADLRPSWEREDPYGPPEEEARRAGSDGSGAYGPNEDPNGDPVA